MQPCECLAVPDFLEPTCTHPYIWKAGIAAHDSLGSTQVQPAGQVGCGFDAARCISEHRSSTLACSTLTTPDHNISGCMVVPLCHDLHVWCCVEQPLTNPHQEFLLGTIQLNSANSKQAVFFVPWSVHTPELIPADNPCCVRLPCLSGPGIRLALIRSSWCWQKVPTKAETTRPSHHSYVACLKCRTSGGRTGGV